MIKSPQNLLITEGNSDKLFFEEFCNYLKLQNIKIISIVSGSKSNRGGKTVLLNAENIETEIKRIEESEENITISKVALICDADFEETENEFSGFNKTAKKLKNVKEKLEKEYKNKKIEYFILPNHEGDGYLENLFLDSIDKELKKLQECADKYIKCSEEEIAKHNQYKIKAEIILKIKSHNEKQFIHDVGNAAKKDNKQQYWNFNSKNLKPLKNFLTQFINK